MTASISAVLAAWAGSLRYEDLPADVAATTRLRVMDVVGLALAGAGTGFGRSVREAATALSPAGPCRILGWGDRVALTQAAFANGAFSQALQYDETHIESIVHMSSPVVAAALALAEILPASGRDLILAVALGNEIACRVGCAAPGELHRRGFHPTGLFTTFGTAALAARMLGLDADGMVRALGIAGSFASGLLQCWVDGTETQFLHPGWSAQAGMTAGFLARAGTTGPAEVFEGRFGLFASHLQDPAAPRDLGRITAGLGTLWESRAASFKPFPAAHVIHPYIDALLRLRREHGIDPASVVRIDCPVAAYIVPLVCEPVAEKRTPATDSHGRVSLQYTLAEALHEGVLGRDAYRAASLGDPAILALAARVRFEVDPGFPGPGQFKGAVRVTLADGRVLEAVEEHTRGSPQNPMGEDALRAKFEDNASGFLGEAARRRLADAIARLDALAEARAVVDLAVPGD